MSRRTLSPKARRGWAIGLLVFFVLMIGGIAVSEWYAYNVNVPRYQRQGPH